MILLHICETGSMLSIENTIENNDIVNRVKTWICSHNAHVLRPLHKESKRARVMTTNIEFEYNEQQRWGFVTFAAHHREYRDYLEKMMRECGSLEYDTVTGI